MAEEPDSSVGRVETRFFDLPPSALPFKLRRGGALGGVRLAYETYGTLNEDRSNAVLVFHALTGSQHAAGFNPAVEGVGEIWNDECQEGWWDAFIGPGRMLDTSRYFVICANYLGGCYGSTGPMSASPRSKTGKPYAADFPQVTFSDIVESQMLLLDHLGVDTLHAAVGCSIGGMMCLLLAANHPERVRNLIPIATGAEVSLLQQILNLEQIKAIEGDPNFKGGRYAPSAPPNRGMAFARMISHKTFFSIDAIHHRAHQRLMVNRNGFQWYNIHSPLESYLIHQGEKFVRRFDANAYLRIIDAWQKFDLLQESGASDFRSLFERCRQHNFLVFSIDSDVCFYPEAQKRLVELLRTAGVSATWVTVNSDKGHDSFLLEPELFSPYVTYHLDRG